jgi:hypothetical protein
MVAMAASQVVQYQLFQIEISIFKPRKKEKRTIIFLDNLIGYNIWAIVKN